MFAINEPGYVWWQVSDDVDSFMNIPWEADSMIANLDHF